MDGRSMTIRSLPKFLGFICYQIYLAMVLRWRATRVGSAISVIYKTLYDIVCRSMLSVL